MHIYIDSPGGTVDGVYNLKVNTITDVVMKKIYISYQMKQN